MASKRPNPEETVSNLWRVDGLLGRALSDLDAIRRIGAVGQTYYRWRKQTGGKGVGQLEEVKRLQRENERFR